MSRWIDSNLADRLYMVQKRINFPVPMIHVPMIHEDMQHAHGTSC